MKTAIITGVTGAIGGAVTREFDRDGSWNLVLVGRSRPQLETVRHALKHPASAEIVIADLSNTSSVKTAVDEIKRKYSAINAIINIAAVYKQQKELTPAGQETMFSANHLGPFTLTNGLMDLLKATPDARVLTVSAPTTTKLDFENLKGEKKFSALNAFGASKMCNLLFTFRLAREFQKSGQSALAYHPGLVKSNLLKEAPAMLRGFLRLVSTTPEKTARSIYELVGMPTSSTNGKFFTKGPKEIKPAAYSRDEVIQDKLWAESTAITGAS
jgi:NAD(P)-dependent dehydrogenase (short-subunit alcohol dehydrogenase family)